MGTLKWKKYDIDIYLLMISNDVIMIKANAFRNGCFLRGMYKFDRQQFFFWIRYLWRQTWKDLWFFWKCNFFIHGSGVGTNEVQKTYGIRMVDIMWKSTFHFNAKIKKNLLLAKYVWWSYWTLHLSLAALRPCSAMAFISWAFSAKIETYSMYWGVKHSLVRCKDVMCKILYILKFIRMWSIWSTIG